MRKRGIRAQVWLNKEENTKLHTNAAYSGTSGRRIRRHPDRCTGIIRTAFPAVSGHLVEYVF